MQDYPNEETLMIHIIRSRYGIVEFDQKAIEEIAPLLQDASNTLVFLSSKSFEKECQKKDYWY